MADPAELSPADLDDLEDALEHLDTATVSVVAPHLRRRLDDYRNILTLSRSAMPMVEIPSGLLEGVLAQARAATEVAAVTPTPVVIERPSLWSRMRKFALLPGVALAGAAAAVLIMVDSNPKQDVAAARAGEVVAGVPAAAEPRGPDEANRQDAKREEAPFRFAEPTPAVSSTTPTAAPGAAAPPPPADKAPDADLEAPAEEEAEGELGRALLGEEKQRKGKEELAKTESDDADGKPSAGGDAPAPVADPDMPRWDIIARGDRARHKGDCRVARNEYALALADADTRVRARAHAGLGLCDAADGDRTSADAAYRAARELDAEIASFIDDERPRSGSGVSSAKAAKSKPKAKNADALEGL